MYGHIQIVLTSTKKVDNVIPTWDRHIDFGYTLRVGLIKIIGNIGISPLSSILREVLAHE